MGNTYCRLSGMLTALVKKEGTFMNGELGIIKCPDTAGKLPGIKKLSVLTPLRCCLLMTQHVHL